MIRYAISKEALIGRVDALEPQWRKKATALQQTVNTRGRYDNDAGIWSDIKPVFMDLQANKCVYCERALGAKKFGKGEHDVEHFRPKSAISAWPPVAKSATRRKAAQTYDFATGAASDIGYYWLAYQLDNYATACKSCNTGLKSSFFPILGKRAAKPGTVSKLNSAERPLLIYPIGNNATDPRRLIVFDGIVAKPKSEAPGSSAFRRARVTIDFFDLNGREELLQARFQVIRELFAQFEIMNTSPSTTRRAEAKTAITDLTSQRSPHSACAQDYLQLLTADPERAHTVILLARANALGGG